MTTSPRGKRSLLIRAMIVVAGLLLVIGITVLALIVRTADATHLDRRAPALQGVTAPAIVLGMGPGGQSPILDRADLAAELWRRGHVSFFVTSGGQGRDEVEPESTTLRNALIDRGVPADRIREESASTSTRENLIFSRRILEENGMLPRPVLIVTHDFHAHRTEALARAQGYEPIVVTTEGERLNRRSLRMVREVIAMLRVWLLP